MQLNYTNLSLEITAEVQRYREINAPKRKNKSFFNNFLHNLCELFISRI